MNRKFVRVSLGGVHDEAEIRGHRRTYIGALPGNIIQAIRKAGTRDCVMMLDEIDKLGAGIQGDPASAMLEVLDPEQNNTFRDNYLGVPFDLSRVVFIATANMLDTVPGPLRDRMEIISLTGYTASEKFQIARRYLVRRQLNANGLKPEHVEIADDAIRAVVEHYTREAGVRSLEREIGRVLRQVAMRIAEGESGPIAISANDLLSILGPPPFEDEVAMRTSIPGVATGLAWTPVGGDILFIEATATPGGGRLILTGQLGDVMKESAQAALSIVKNRASSYGIDPARFEKTDIHIHVPAGATPKDGPSAGVAMFMALVSLLTDRTIRSDTAMTGEVSLRGLVLPVGGIKEKVVAAHRAGLRRVMLPARNRRDFDDIPEEVREEMTFVWLETGGRCGRLGPRIRRGLTTPTWVRIARPCLRAPCVWAESAWAPSRRSGRKVRQTRFGFSWRLALCRETSPICLLDFLGFLSSESRLINGLRGIFAIIFFSSPFPGVASAGHEHPGEGIRKRRIIHGASVSRLMIFCNHLSSEPFLRRPPSKSSDPAFQAT